MPDARFPQSRRVLKTAEFDRVFRRRRSQSDSVLTLYACENELPYARLGLVVSRKCGNAVARNLWKRALREAFRLTQHSLPAGFDLVVLARPGRPAPANRLQLSLTQLAARAVGQLSRSAAGPASEATPP